MTQSLETVLTNRCNAQFCIAYDLVEHEQEYRDLHDELSFITRRRFGEALLSKDMLSKYEVIAAKYNYRFTAGIDYMLFYPISMGREAATIHMMKERNKDA